MTNLQLYLGWAKHLLNFDIMQHYATFSSRYGLLLLLTLQKVCDEMLSSKNLPFVRSQGALVPQ